MTTKPKARKFRIRRATPSAGSTSAPENKPAPDRPSAVPTRAEGGSAADQLRMARQSTADTAPPKPARTGEVASATQMAGETDMDAIRREGLTGRQLRMARRVAQKHELAPTSDFDAVRLLREKGIDPFQRSNMLELVVPQAGGEQHEGGAPDAFSQLPAQAAGSGRVQLPQTVQAGQQMVPATDLSPAERRSREITEIQRDISRRRRRKMGLLLVRLAFFVFLPTIFAGYYFFKVATPMYATESDFLIIQNEGSGGAGPLGGLLPTQFATSADSIAVQSYLQSKDAMLRLDADVGFKDHFTQDFIDPVQRLTPDPSNEEAYKLYKKNIKIGYDPTEGMVRMEVVAADPEVSAEFSRRLISYAQARVNNLSQEKRDDQMGAANNAYEKALKERRGAEESLIKLQVENGVDPEAQIASIRTTITQYEALLIEKQLELSALLDNTRPNRAKVEGAQGDVRRIQEQLDKLNQRLNSSIEGENSLAQQAIEMQLAQADLANANTNLQLAQAQLEQARTEANRQVRYLTIAVDPVASEEASYPRSFENTILAFLIFAGIYLMISLTASILREQVTS